MVLEYINWNANPEIFRIGSFAIRWYGLFFALSFYLSYLYMGRVFKKEKLGVDLLDKLTLYMILGTVIGARLGHCLFYQPDVYLRNPLEILKIWEGGLASHGAAVGIIFSLWLFSRRNGMAYLWLLDRIVIVVALSGFLIRMGNLMNSEIYGKVTNLPWAFIFERDDLSLSPRHPTQIYEGLVALLIFAGFALYYKRVGAAMKNGFLFSIFLILLFSFRFAVEFLKEPQVSFESSFVLNMGQILSLPFIFAGIFLLTRVLKNPVTNNQ